MAILFSPFTAAIVVAYVHLLIFLCFCACELKKIAMASKILRVVMGSLNLVLMIIGTAEIKMLDYL
jgi:hypothetical protein